MTLSPNAQQYAEEIAKDALTVIHSIATHVKTKLEEGRTPPTMSVFASGNSFTGGMALKNLSCISEENTRDLQVLNKEPVIARIVVETNDGEKIYYISRASPAPMPNSGITLASYKSPIGRLASHSIGDTVKIGNTYFEIVGRTHLHPEYSGQDWDSVQNIIQCDDFGTLTVASFRLLLNKRDYYSDIDENILDSILAEDKEQEIIFQGVRRSIIQNMELRDQPILDKYQDEIFRLPLASQLLIIGPPGTGKTTTLIRRLGQKLDSEYLSQDEKEAIQITGSTSHLPHPQSWVMFTPTELLKQYIKEAFNRENIPASDERIKTWADYRRYLAKNVLGILKTENTGGSFFLKEGLCSLKDESIINCTQWYDEFSRFFHENLVVDFRDSAMWLSQQDDEKIAAIGRTLVSILKPCVDEVSVANLRQLDKQVEYINKSLKQYKENADGLIKKKLNFLLNSDRDFLSKLAEYIDSIRDDSGFIESEGDEMDDDADENSEKPKNHSVKSTTKTDAYNSYFATIRTLAQAQIVKKELKLSTRSGKIIQWLDGRIPSNDDLHVIGKSSLIQGKLRQFTNPYYFYLSKVPSSYSNFRKICKKEGRWYTDNKFPHMQISALETDVNILLILKNATRLINGLPDAEIVSNNQLSLLRTIQGIFYNQVLVDEVTDFSPIQLACMLELSHPQIRSFFACGDFNQRVTSWGVRQDTQIKWISSAIETRSISVAYRQSKLLNEFAGELAVIDGFQSREVFLPDRVDNEGLPPVLIENVSELDVLAQWLSQRIIEIEKLIKILPSIAILVNGEKDVQPLANALNNKLEEYNIRAVSCPEGRVIGQENDVRVFDVQHIKGLEFEAVFFVGIDQLAQEKPELFSKFLYVGATRAATYFGVTCVATLPEQLQGMRSKFSGNWRV